MVFFLLFLAVLFWLAGMALENKRKALYDRGRLAITVLDVTPAGALSHSSELGNGNTSMAVEPDQHWREKKFEELSKEARLVYYDWKQSQKKLT